jgi:hypothetical protein
MVGVWKQQVECRRSELKQPLVGAHRVVFDIDRAQDSAVAVLELRRSQQVEPVGDRVETVAAVCVEPVPPGRVRVPVQADTYLDPEVLERGEHWTVEEGPVGLEGHIHLGRHPGTEQSDEARQPLSPGEQGLAAVQDDVDAGEAVLTGVLGNALNGSVGHGGTHSLGQPTPALIRHFIDITVRARQIAATVDF